MDLNNLQFDFRKISNLMARKNNRCLLINFSVGTFIVFLKIKNHIMQILNVTLVYEEDFMKSYIKVFVFLFLGLLTAGIIYPFLHELGHAIATIAVGAECMEFHLLPAPYVLCDMSTAGNMEFYIVGFAGVVFPMIIVFFLRFLCSKSIYVDYLTFVIKGITVLACLITIVSITLLGFGCRFQEDDVVNVLIKTDASSIAVWMIILFLIAFVTAVLMSVIKQKTLNRIVEYIIKTPEKSGANFA